jgi:hypothetical protein
MDSAGFSQIHVPSRIAYFSHDGTGYSTANKITFYCVMHTPELTRRTIHLKGERFDNVHHGPFYGPKVSRGSDAAARDKNGPMKS